MSRFLCLFGHRWRATGMRRGVVFEWIQERCSRCRRLRVFSLTSGIHFDWDREQEVDLRRRKWSFDPEIADPEFVVEELLK